MASIEIKNLRLGDMLTGQLCSMLVVKIKVSKLGGLIEIGFLRTGSTRVMESTCTMYALFWVCLFT